MSTWNLRHDDASPSPVTQTLEAWGISNVVVTERIFAPGTLTFDIAGDFDTAPLFAYGDRITLLEGSTVRWTGRIRQLPQSARGENEVRSYMAEDVLGDLARRTFRQIWKLNNGEGFTDTSLSRLVLFRDETAAAVSIGAQVQAVIEAAADAGVEVQFGTASGMTANPQAVDAKTMTFLEALKLCCRFAPDACTVIDHTTTPPTLSLVRRVNAIERSLAVIDTADDFEATPLKDQQVSGVHLTYRKQAVFAGQPYLAVSVEKYPVDITGDEENCLIAEHELEPQQLVSAVTQSQYIETVAIDPEDFDWWVRLWPALADRNLAATLTDGEIVDTPSEDNMILSGAQPEWTGTAATVIVRATFNGVINGREYVGEVLEAAVNASSLATNTYSRTQTPTVSDPGSSVPSGLAQLLYNALNPLAYSGRHSAALSELEWTIRVGDVLNFTGTDDSALTTARAQVQSITRNLDSAERTIEFGTAPFLNFNDLLDLLRSQSTLKQGREFERSGEAIAADLQVDGAGMGPGYNFTTPDPTPTHPFRVAHIGGDDFRVEGGQIDGLTLATETIDVGASRPVAIRIYPQFTVGVYNSEFVYSAVIKGSPDEPVFETNASLDDVTEFSSAGNEPRCVIATIDANNVVTQLATVNITTSSQDDGSLTGTGQMTFLKS